MCGRLVVLAVLVLVTGACASDRTPSDKPIPGMDTTHRVEQINTPARSGQRAGD